jgi:hypothetical protein
MDTHEVLFFNPGMGTTGIGNFIVSNIDTNLILGLYSEGPCGSPEGTTYNLISYNSDKTVLIRFKHKTV